MCQDRGLNAPRGPWSLRMSPRPSAVQRALAAVPGVTADFALPLAHPGRLLNPQEACGIMPSEPFLRKGLRGGRLVSPQS